MADRVATKIAIGHGGFGRYRYRREDKPHWLAMAAAVAPEGMDWRSRRRLHRAVRDCIDPYRATTLLWEGAARPNDVRKELRKVAEAAVRLNNIIAGLGPAGAHRLSKQFHPFRPIEDLCNKISAISGAATRAANRLPADRGGRTPHVPAHWLVKRLAATFEDETGRRASRHTWDDYDEKHRDSPFVTFAREALRLAGHGELEQDALDTLIRRSRC